MRNPALKEQLPLPMFRQCSDTFKPVERELWGVEPTKGCDLLLCCADLPDFVYAQFQVGGYGFESVPKVTPIPRLPRLICSIEGDQGHRPYMAAVRDLYWAVKYQSAVAGDLSDKDRLIRWRARQGIPPGKRLIFHQESSDLELNCFFDKEHNPKFFELLQSMPDSIFISPGYSVYDDGNMCRHYQLLNLKRSLDFFVRATAHGLRCIPSLGWSTQRDLERIAEWIKKHPGLRHIAINCQTLRKDQYAKLRSDMSFIERASHRRLQWVVFGGTEAINALHRSKFLGRISLISASLIQRARAGRTIDSPSISPVNKVESFKYSRALMLSRLTVYKPLLGTTTVKESPKMYPPREPGIVVDVFRPRLRTPGEIVLPDAPVSR